MASSPHTENPTNSAPDQQLTSGTEATRWRGLLHAWFTPLAIVLGMVLIVLAEPSIAEWYSAVFALTAVLLFGVSALYHRGTWGPKRGIWLRRADHANIFLLIAGTYTPMSLALEPSQRNLLLIIIWIGALSGALLRIFWPTAPRWLTVSLYLLLGWGAVMYLPAFYQLNPLLMVLIIAGGLLYTAGAVFYALKRPNPWPGVFGFHELFHAGTIAGFLCHWFAILLVVS